MEIAWTGTTALEAITRTLLLSDKRCLRMLLRAWDVLSKNIRKDGNANHGIIVIHVTNIFGSVTAP